MTTAPALFPRPDTAAPTMPTAPTGPTPTVIALDIALNITGVAGTGWTTTIRTGTRRAERRLMYLKHEAASYYRNADFVVLEGPAYSQAKQAGHDELAAARWFIRCDLTTRGIPFAIVTPDGRTIYATGKARHTDPVTGEKLTSKQVKGLVRDAVATRYGIECEGVGRYDMADAYTLLSMGLHWLGHPLAAVPASHSRALKGVAWPEREAVAR